VTRLLSLIIPAYNEATTIENNVEIIKNYLGSLNTNYEIIIAEDGSVDGTYKIIRKLVKKSNAIRSLHKKEKLGRGYALKKAFLSSKGNVIGFIDADISAHPKYLADMVNYTKGYDVVTASRYAKGSHVERPFIRDLIARVYYWLLRRIFSCNIYDFQCGLKLFSRTFIEKEIKYIKEKSWAWDTVILIEAIKKGYKIKEVPIKWIEKKEISHSASFKRLLSDFFIHGKVIVKLFAKWNLGIKLDV